MASTTGIIKSDSKGRNRYTAQYREELLDAYECSGLSGIQFAKQCGVKYPTFASWVKKREKARQSGDLEPGSRKESQAFLLAEIRDSEPGDGIEVSLPGGMTARTSGRQGVGLLAALVKALS